MGSRWKDIRAITFDVDGVMTDGGLVATDDGSYLRVFNAKDSFALRFAAMKGYIIAVFTGGDTPGVRNRMLSAGVPEENIHMHCRGKLEEWLAFCRQYGLDPSEVVYVGDDIPDLPVVKAAGIGAVPADAARDVCEAADYICDAEGGKGCLREIVEKAMRASGKWKFDPDIFEKIY